MQDPASLVELALVDIAVKVIDGLTHAVNLVFAGSLHHDTLSLRPRPEEPVAGSLGTTGGDSTVRRAEDALHEFGLGLPVVFVILDDAEGINPEEMQTKAAGDVNGIPESLWKERDIDGLGELLDVRFVRAELGVLLR